MPSREKAQFVFLGSKPGRFDEKGMPQIVFCHKRSDIENLLSHPAGQLAKRITLISFSIPFTDLLLKKTIESKSDFRNMGLITLKPPRPESIPSLLGMFHPVCGLVEGFSWLPEEELAEVVTREDAGSRFIGGNVDFKGKSLTLLRGNMDTIVAPFSLFAPSGDHLNPDFRQFLLTDYGQTVALGKYEASADAILYELDREYRRELKKYRKQHEKSFGASLLRLRKQLKMKRTDFEPLNSKAIARIERGEVAKPHARTIALIAQKLKIQPEEIENY